MAGQVSNTAALFFKLRQVELSASIYYAVVGSGLALLPFRPSYFAVSDVHTGEERSKTLCLRSVFGMDLLLAIVHSH